MVSADGSAPNSRTTKAAATSLPHTPDSTHEKRRKNASIFVGDNPDGSHAHSFQHADARSIRTSAHTVISKFPELNCVINNADLQRPHDFSLAGSVNETAMHEEIETNLLGLMRACT